MHINVSGAYCSVAQLLAISISPCNAYIASGEGDRARERSDSPRSRFRLEDFKGGRLVSLIFFPHLAFLFSFPRRIAFESRFIAFAVIVAFKLIYHTDVRVSR